MNPVARQGGFVLLIMLTILLVAGAAGFTGLAASTRHAAGYEFSADQRALRNSRQALLSYTALYPYLYGPGGAGPGHFPCPDTDSTSPSLVWANDRGAPDGPNPPCGSGVVAAGKLPRHVNLPVNRYAFHTQPFQRFGYVTSSDVINNPTNRIVNDRVELTGSGIAQSLIAWVERDRVDEAGTHALPLRAPITRAALLLGVRASVAAWVVNRVNRQKDGECTPSIDAADFPLDENSIQLLRWIVDGVPVTKDSRHSDSIAMADAVTDEAVVEAGTFYPARWSPHLLHACSSTVVTEERGVDELSIENVPLVSHWFYRNQWHRRVTLALSEQCRHAVSSSCQIYHEPAVQSQASMHPDDRLHFVWRVVH